MEKKKDRRILKTQTTIQQAFIDLFEEKNYSDITVKDLAEKADISRKTFYLHYTSLDDLLTEYIRRRFTELSFLFASLNFGRRKMDYLGFFTRIRRDIERSGISLFKLLNDPLSRRVILQEADAQAKILMEKYQHLYDLHPDVLQMYMTYLVRGLITMYAEWIRSADPIPIEDFAAAAGEMNEHAKMALSKYRRESS